MQFFNKFRKIKFFLFIFFQVSSRFQLPHRIPHRSSTSTPIHGPHGTPTTNYGPQWVHQIRSICSYADSCAYVTHLGWRTLSSTSSGTDIVIVSSPYIKTMWFPLKMYAEYVERQPIYRTCL